MGAKECSKYLRPGDDRVKETLDTRVAAASVHRDTPSMVTRPVMAIIASMIRLNCRIVVLDTLFWIGCKSAKMSAMGFLFEFSLGGLLLYYKKPFHFSLFLAKVLYKSFFIYDSAWKYPYFELLTAARSAARRRTTATIPPAVPPTPQMGPSSTAHRRKKTRLLRSKYRLKSPPPPLSQSWI
jgi:hypothetical protein